MRNVEEVPLQPDPSCAVCSHPQRLAGSAMRDMNASMEEIAIALQLDPDEVERHFTACVPKVLLPEDGDTPFAASDQQLELLLQNSCELYYSAALMGNMVAASSALAVRLRCLTEIGRRAEAKAEHQELLLGADPRDPQTWPRDLADFVNAYHDDILNRLDEVIAHEQN